MRLFIALPLPDDARAAVTALQSRLPDGRPVPEEQLHITLVFLGEQHGDAAEACHEALETLMLPAFDIRLTGPVLFGGRHGRALGLHADGGAPLVALHDRIRSRLHGAGVDVERRRFRPHLTLARLRAGTDPAAGYETLIGHDLPPFAAERFLLVHSTLRPEGALHETLAEYPLGLCSA
ncbi:RNA 2',3'-cyclic phosphodiesterase [Cognatishimia sp. F0-27]|uniref:RNA 2',3'-cyclic phosphodiesterase n=1 Tax=Cognatishimia sp. F0-27 TaxID=2816855 RepID=UPI001D0CDA55|nr:RNA 2',3'-cyclic phosphodiesterase [Cognatishimia sp. F0-27]MCC1493772.1 RNA 2',3'-cyclic phosphodiesterase [Cognatishimia sp. F0-27]